LNTISVLFHRSRQVDNVTSIYDELLGATTVQWHIDEGRPDSAQLILVAFSHFLIIRLLSKVPDKRYSI